MIRNQRPCKTLGLFDKRTEPFYEKIPIGIIVKYLLAGNPSGDNMVQCAGSITNGVTIAIFGVSPFIVTLWA